MSLSTISLAQGLAQSNLAASRARLGQSGPLDRSYRTSHGNSVDQDEDPNRPTNDLGRTGGARDSVHFSAEARRDTVHQEGYHDAASVDGNHDTVAQEAANSSATVRGSHDQVDEGFGSDDHVTLDGSNQRVSVSGNGITATYRNGQWTASQDGGTPSITEQNGWTLIG